MSNILEEETKKSSLAEALQPPLPPVPIKTTPLLPLPVPNPVHEIADSAVGTPSSAFPDLFTKAQLNSILNRK